MESEAGTAVAVAVNFSGGPTDPGREPEGTGNVVVLRAATPPGGLGAVAPPPSWKLRRVLLAADAAAASTAWALVLAAGGAPELSPTGRVAVVTSLTVLTLSLLHLHQLYLARICRVRAVEVSRLARVAILAAAIAYLVAGRLPVELTAAWAVRGAVFSFLGLAFARSVYSSWLKRLRSQGQASRPVVIVGDNEEGAHLRRHFERHPELGMSIVATVAYADGVLMALQRHHADSVVIAVSAFGTTELNNLSRRLLDAGVHVHISCGLAGVDHRRLRQVPLAHEPLFYLERLAISRTQMVLSRALDIVGSAVGLVLAAPVVAVAAILIKAHDRGPVLFRQERIGRDGRPFMLLKLRTMVPDAESRLASMQANNHRDGPLFKAVNDSRVTRVGRVLRATSVDELPQLVNVFLGSMSLVGPRPALAHEVEQFDAELLKRLRVRPGMTGLWQVEARHDPSFESYRTLDLFYLENWSLELDLVILLGTVKVLVGQALRDMSKQLPSALPARESLGSVEIEAGPTAAPVRW